METTTDHSCKVRRDRTAVRYIGTQTFKATLFIDLDNGGSEEIAGLVVKDFNLQGCRLVSQVALDSVSQGRLPMVVSFRGEAQQRDQADFDGERFQATIVALSQDRTQVSLRFHRPLRLEKIGNFNRFFVEPKMDSPEARRVVYEQQEKVALGEIRDLQADVRSRFSRQFSLLSVGVPAVGSAVVASGLLLFDPKVLSNAEGVVDAYPGLRVLIPLLAGLVSVFGFVVFLQQSRTIRAQRAFVLLLQRYITLGSFPPCYRGWYDADSILQQYLLHGAEGGDPFRLRPKVKDGFGITRRSPYPKDPFTTIGVFSFSVLSLSAIGFSLFALAQGIPDGEAFSPTKVVIASTVLGIASVILALALIREVIQVQFGKRTTRHMIYLYSELMKCAPPYDPMHTGPIRLDKRSAGTS